MNKRKNIKIFNISAILLTYLLAAFSCQDTVRVDKFDLPDDVLQDATTSFIKNDSEGLVKDYSLISSGQKLSDGYTIADPTDAERIDKAVQSGRTIVFLRVSEEADGREHALRTLASAAMRMQARSADQAVMFNLNLDAINRLIATYDFTDEQAREYYLSVAKKLNDEKLSEKNVVVVDVDRLERGLNPEALFEALSKPSIIAVSKESKDTLKLAPENQKSEEVKLTNLDPGEIFSLSKQRIERSAGFKNDKAAADKTALVVAKVVAATDPKDNLGNFNRILRAIRPVIEQEPLSATYEADITKAIAAELGLDVKYINSLNLQSETLTSIRTTVRDDPNAFSKQARQTEEIFNKVKLLTPTAGRLTPGDLGQVEQRVRRVMGDTETTLLSDADQKRDELQNAIEDSLKTVERRGQSQIDKAAKGIKDATANVIKKVEQSIREEGTGNRDALADRIDANGSDIKDAVRRAVGLNGQRASNELKQAASGIKNDLTKALDKAKLEINNNTSDGLKAIEERIEAAGAQVIARAQAIVTNAQNALDRTAQKRVTSAAERVIKDARAAIDEARQAIKDRGDEQAQRLSDDIRAAADGAHNKGQAALKQAADRINANASALVRKAEQKLSDLGATLEQLSETTVGKIRDALEDSGKAIAKANRASVDGAAKSINDNTQAAVAKAEQRINSQTALGQDDLGKRIADAEAELGDKIAKLPSKSDAQRQLDQAVRKVNDNTKSDIAKAREQITENGDANKQELKQRIKESGDDIRSSQDALNKKGQQAVESATKKINDNTAAAVTKAEQRIKDQIQEARNLIENNGELLQKLDEQIREKIGKVIISNNENAKAVRKAVETIVKNEGRLTREQIQSAEGEVTRIVQEESERSLAEMETLPNKTRKNIGALFRSVNTVLGSDYLFYGAVFRLIRDIVIAADVVPANNPNAGVGEDRLTRINNATIFAYNSFIAGQPAATVVAQAVAGLQDNTPYVIAPSAPSLAAIAAIQDPVNGLANLVNEIRRFRSL